MSDSRRRRSIARGRPRCRPSERRRRSHPRSSASTAREKTVFLDQLHGVQNAANAEPPPAGSSDALGQCSGRRWRTAARRRCTTVALRATGLRPTGATSRCWCRRSCCPPSSARSVRPASRGANATIPHSPRCSRSPTSGTEPAQAIGARADAPRRGRRRDRGRTTPTRLRSLWHCRRDARRTRRARRRAAALRAAALGRLAGAGARDAVTGRPHRRAGTGARRRARAARSTRHAGAGRRRARSTARGWACTAG